MVPFEVNLAGRGKRTIGSIYLSPTNHVREEGMRGYMKQLPPPIKLMKDFSMGKQKTSTSGKILEQILDKFLLCLNEKEETYYTAYDGCKSTIDLTLNNSSRNDWVQEYDFRGSDHLLIILRN